MIVQCAKCSTKFKIADDKVTAAGVKVRCSKCKNIFVVKKDQAPAGDESAPEAAAPQQFSLPPPPSALQDNIFSQPTRVAPPPAGGDFPIPAPAVALGNGRSLADLIDLDSDDQPFPPASSPPTPVPPPLPATSPPAPVPPPPPATPLSELGEDLFKDLGDIEIPPPPAEQPPAPAGPLPPPPEASVASIPPVAAPAPPAPAASQPPASPAPAEVPGVVQAPEIDDPFADIDLGPSPASPAPAAPATPPAPPQESDDLFGSLGDPFAGVGSPAAAPFLPPEATAGDTSGEPSFSPSPPSPPPAASGGEDPFATGLPVSGKDLSTNADASMEGVLSGNDPFAGPGDGADVDSSPSGLQLDENGQLVGEDVAPPPPPTKTLPPPPADTASADKPVPLPEAAPTPSALELASGRVGGMLLVYKIGFGLLALVVAMLAFVAFRSGGKPDLTSWSTYARAFGLTGLARQHSGPLLVDRQSNTTYRNRDGQRLLLVWGQVKNTSRQPASGITVSVRLVDELGRQVVAKTVPAGVVFRPEQVFSMTTPEQVDSAYRQAIAKKRPSLGGNEQLPFMCVMFDYPTGLDKYEFLVEAAPSGDPWLGLGPPEQAVTGNGSPAGDRPGSPPPLRKLSPPAGKSVRTGKTSGDVVRLKQPAGPASARRP